MLEPNIGAIKIYVQSKYSSIELKGLNTLIVYVITKEHQPLES
jgi:hypothetical protein